jgi:6-phosphogluconate dehydrogenase
VKSEQLECAVIGLGKMGGNLARSALSRGVHVVGFNIGGIDADLKKAGLVAPADYSALRQELKSPRLVLLYLPAGRTVDEVIENLANALEPGDVIADGGNSYWGDSIERFENLKKSGIEFIDLGTSGGPGGALTGASFMMGGSERARVLMTPLLTKLAIENGVINAGPSGAGHFVKLVHNGIEFGMMQAMGEGIDLLHNYKDRLDVSSILQGWRHGTVIRSWLLDLLAQAYASDDGLENIKGYVEDTGEVNWLVGDAAEMEVSIPVIAQSVWKLIDSRDSVKVWAKAIAVMRHGFGGHPFGPAANVASYRHTSRAARLASEFSKAAKAPSPKRN